MVGPDPAVIFDVDGTLVDVSGVRHDIADNAAKKDFRRFHSAASFRPPVASTHGSSIVPVLGCSSSARARSGGATGR
ncbi:hypothetical protein C5C00_02855 [Rathayibacter rathayi]|uniref:hypothetical protein n=1 Tax=Rathayibacter rathayi TaxID=33887 RepID=UPI000CE80524|nr:hypothetical protein [Rathayibacter rathayi]PPG89340.1 hypothetical protein C5C47_05190 [Rathayibacter rathayi]PPG98546.1 hypothetical protein C5C00_02855 [Rathayibacter rathayi]